jgi:hypothetical protein
MSMKAIWSSYVMVVTLLSICGGSHVHAQVLTSVSPMYLLSAVSGGDEVVSVAGRTEVDKAISINVYYWAAGLPFGSAPETVLENFDIRDGSNIDLDPRAGPVKATLPAEFFQRAGQYLITLASGSGQFPVVRDIGIGADDSGWFFAVAESLVNAAGSGFRGEVQDRLSNHGSTDVVLWPITTKDLPRSRDEVKHAITHAMMPSWSPDGKRLAAALWRNERWVIGAFMIEDPGAAQPLWEWPGGHTHSDDFSPTWSPGGKHLAFLRRTSSGSCDVWLIELDDGGRPTAERQITHSALIEQIVGWNDESQLLLKLREEGDHPAPASEFLWSVKIAKDQPTASLTLVPNALPSEWLLATKLSDTEKIVSLAAGATSVSQLFLISQDALPVQVLEGETVADRWPAVSPTGRFLAFDSTGAR